LQGVQVQLSRSPCFPAKLASEYWCGHLCEGIKRMKLYYAPGTCSLAPHIVAKEAGLTFQLVRVDIGGTPHRTSTGRDYTAINLKGYVPALELDNGELLTEGAAILQYLADRAPEAQLAPPAGTLE